MSTEQVSRFTDHSSRSAQSAIVDRFKDHSYGSD